jgi:PBSX family phage terminase large subunit
LSLQANELEIPVNDCYIPLYENQSRFLVLPGGAGSGKSIFCADKVVHRVLCEEDHKILCLRKVGDTVEESIFAEITAAIEFRGVTEEFKVNKTKHSFTHLPTGNQILCKGLDDVAKMKSVKGITAMWLEEATEFEENDLDQLNLRIRGQKTNYVQYLLSFNPIDEQHWLKRRFIDQKDEDATILVTTYKDNQYLTEQDIQQLLKLASRNPLYFDVYVLAKWGVVVKSDKFLYAFSNQKHIIESYQPNPHLPIIASFDFNVSPMTCVIAQNFNDKTYIFDEFRLNVGSTEEMAELVKAKYKDWLYRIDVTGDATGKNREKATRGNINQYMVIKEVLQLADRDIDVPSKNPELKDSRVLCNSVLQHAEFYVTKNCTLTVNDMIYAAVKFNPMTKKMDVIKTEEEKRDFFDNARYIIHKCYPDFIRNPKKYRR